MQAARAPPPGSSSRAWREVRARSQPRADCAGRDPESGSDLFLRQFAPGVEQKHITLFGRERSQSPGYHRRQL